jgi:hypothetical protein
MISWMLRIELTQISGNFIVKNHYRRQPGKRNKQMTVYIGFDDTDILGADTGTGKLARNFERLIPAPCRVLGVVRQQLLVDPAIPYTSHNSSACVILENMDPALDDRLLALAIEHIELAALPGSDPGLCFARSDHPNIAALQNFGLKCTRQIVTQNEALRAAASIHLSGHGGTHDGIIGAAAAVGLTASGWYGRFIECSGLRNFPDPVSVSALAQKSIRVVSLDRDAITPCPEDEVHTKGWLRPRLWGSQAVLPVNPSGPGRWESIGEKRNKQKPKKKEE